MLSTLPKEDLSRTAKALLILLQWAEQKKKEELIEELPEKKKHITGLHDDNYEENNTKTNSRRSTGEISRAPQVASYSSGSI